MIKFSEFRALSCLTASVVALATASSSYAQAIGMPPQGAAVANESATDVGEIIVTAQKRSQRLQDVPLSVQAVSAAALENAVVNDLTDLQVVTPGLIISRSVANSSPYIRGVGTISPLTGTESAVAIYVDGIYQPASVGNTFAFNNISSVEVLKGPQGTLYGRNATGGVINIITRDPSFDTGAEGKVGYGNYDTVAGNLYVTGGLSDSLAVDVAAYYTNQAKGFGRNLTLNRDFLTEKEFAIRNKWLLRIGEATEVRVGVDYTHINSDKGVGAVPIRDGDDGIYTNVDFHDTLAAFPAAARITSWGPSLQIDHDFGDIKLKFTSAYHDVDSYQQFSQFNDPVRPSAVEARTYNAQKSTSNELQLSSKNSGAFTWVSGVFYFTDNAVYKSPNGFTVDAATPFGQLRVANIRSTQKLKSISGYADGSYDIGGGTTLTAGIRYTRDSRTYVGGSNATQSVAIVGGVPTVVTIPPATVRDDKASSGRLTYRAVIDHHFSRDAMLYASVSTGFKSGGFAGNTPTNPVLRPELVTAYEVGFKGEALDRRLRFSTAAFRYDYKDLQVVRVVGAAPITENAAGARIEGAEVEGSLAATRQLSLNFGGQWLHARYTDYKNVPTYIPVPGSTTNANGPVIDATGNDLRLAPRFTVNLGVTHKIPLSWGELSWNVNYLYNDGYYFQADERVRQNSFSLVNARIGWQSLDERLGISLWAKNLGNTKYFVACRCTENAGDSGSYGEPRRYGVDASFKF